MCITSNTKWISAISNEVMIICKWQYSYCVDFIVFIYKAVTFRSSSHVRKKKSQHLSFPRYCTQANAYESDSFHFTIPDYSVCSTWCNVNGGKKKLSTEILEVRIIWLNI